MNKLKNLYFNLYKQILTFYPWERKYFCFVIGFIPKSWFHDIIRKQMQSKEFNKRQKINYVKFLSNPKRFQ